MKAWHFVGETLRDGRPVPPDGKWLKHDGELVMCESGLHASTQIIDALRYAPGMTICRVELDGDIVQDYDKLVASKRKILWRIDGESVLRSFARWCALQVIHLCSAPDVVVEYLTTGEEYLRAATWAATWTAASAAASAAAWDAARAAAWDAARAATWTAARAAAWAAARDAARAATWTAASAAASAAAWDAAWDAARAAQNAQLEKMVREAREGKTEWIFDVPESEE